MRLIDADELLNKLKERDLSLTVTEWDIKECKTVDAVPVVRCGECKHGHPDIMSEEYTACRYRQTVMPNDGFCSYGERRTDD